MTPVQAAQLMLLAEVPQSSTLGGCTMGWMKKGVSMTTTNTMEEMLTASMPKMFKTTTSNNETALMPNLPHAVK
jgi:hypothetical protein